jgi:Icc-related predicted phosphoesterase
MRILAFSDLHGNAEHAKAIVAASANADLVLAAGDFCNFHRGLPETVALLASIPCPILAVPGNHETAQSLTAAATPNMTVLHGQAVEIGGISVFGIGYGIPDQPFEAWSTDLTEAEAADLLETCDQADIILSHSPPKNIADRIQSGQNVGSTALRTATERLRPKLLLCGHIHEAWGQSGHIGETKVHNLGPTLNWFDI